MHFSGGCADGWIEDVFRGPETVIFDLPLVVRTVCREITVVGGISIKMTTQGFIAQPPRQA